MRLAISTNTHYHADYYCADSRSAKRLLRENNISLIALDYHLVGREDATEIIQWTSQHNVLPSYVVLIERNRDMRSLLSRALKWAGYRTADETTFIRH